MSEAWTAIVAGLVSGVVGTGITLGLTLRNHRSIYSWNEKYRLYAEVIQCLSTVISYHRSMSHFAYAGGVRPSVDQKMETSRAVERLYRIRLMEGWVLQIEASDILGEGQPMQEDFESQGAVNGADYEHVYHSAVARSRQDQLERIVKVARDDLGFEETCWSQIYRGSWRWVQVNLSLDWSQDPKLRETAFRADCEVCNPGKRRL